MKPTLLACLATIVGFALAPQAALAEAKPSLAVQTEFNAFISKFRAALKANDADAVAGMSQLPFQGDKGVATAKQFGANIFAKSFDKATRRCLTNDKAVYDRDQENNENFFIFCGEEIFTFTKTQKGFLFTDIGMND